MTTQTLTLTEFLLARIADDEAVARSAIAGPWCATKVSPPDGFEDYGDCATIEARGTSTRHIIGIAEDMVIDDALHIARHDPARVLAECAAKRAIVDQFTDDPDFDNYPLAGVRDRTLRSLASVYADHPDFDPA